MKNASKSKPDLAQYETQYREMLPRCERCVAELTRQLTLLISMGNVALGFPIQSRVKSWKSLVAKFESGVLHVKHVSEVQDLIGVRLVLLFRRDIATVRNLISEHFIIEREYDTAEKLKEDQFGYSSYHYVVRIPEAWCEVPTLKDLKGIKIEIQLRTVAQHIWAEASHSLQYKAEVSVPPPILRAIYRVSALLETVDLEFDRVLERREEYRAQSAERPSSEPLNVDLLGQMLDRLLPPENKDPEDEEMYAELLEQLKMFKIETGEQLIDVIERNLKKVLAKDAERVALELTRIQELGEVSGRLRQRLESGVFFTQVGLMRNILRSEFGQEKYKQLLGTP